MLAISLERLLRMRVLYGAIACTLLAILSVFMRIGVGDLNSFQSFSLGSHQIWGLIFGCAAAYCWYALKRGGNSMYRALAVLATVCGAKALGLTLSGLLSFDGRMPVILLLFTNAIVWWWMSLSCLVLASSVPSAVRAAAKLEANKAEEEEE